ncbi:hypothetical protein EOJ32_19515 (plasmid) [Paracoccus sp. Arc7-R13]|uniref:hypothetical protein n=1 Tax=Paracoccus sp. Arc7-R13 TaxID=2500532 RepID=UPI000FDA2EA7|nr:hypothetical protein [Paracoccus sp. Arc7-R13]AZY95973.1 hypothetical protein EOJ32_19470 [Paracoccus sp. Arc7-R13]AZY95981.1 hypothetical protein EOJ32_19515 [Paracoccus sp. Arc7-R13]
MQNGHAGNSVRDNADEDELVGCSVVRAAGLGGRPRHRQSAERAPSEPFALCPPVVRKFLEAVGLSPELPDYARPMVVIDTQGHRSTACPERCLLGSMPKPRRFCIRAASSMAQDQEAGSVCRIGEARLQETSFIGLILSYDLAWMNNPTCLQQAQQDLDVLQDRSPGTPPHSTLTLPSSS